MENKVYKTQLEVEKDIVGGVLSIEGDVKFECSISISASIIVKEGNINARDINARDINARDINARDINAWDINAWDINAWDINARNINAWDINTWDINAWDINTWDINAGNINAKDINARDINAWNINAGNILYYAFCCVYKSIQCLSIKATREVHHKPICLDGEITYKEQEQEVEEMTMEELCNERGRT